jgi:hypothetical protein
VLACAFQRAIYLHMLPAVIAQDCRVSVRPAERRRHERAVQVVERTQHALSPAE